MATVVVNVSSPTTKLADGFRTRMDDGVGLLLVVVSNDTHKVTCQRGGGGERPRFG